MKAKLVSENIRFERGKTPHEAMDIGRDHFMEYEFLTYFDAADWAVRNLDLITDDNYSPNDVIRKQGARVMPEDLVEYLQKWVEKVNLTGYKNEEDIIIIKAAHILTEIGMQMKKHGILVEAVNFERGKDPKEAMGIGNTRKVKALLRFSKTKAGRYIDKEVKEKLAHDLLTRPTLRRTTTTTVLFDDNTVERLDDVMRSGKNLIFNGKIWEPNRYGYTPHELKESVRFERGKDPKEVMGIGRLNQRDFDSIDDIADWMINFSWRVDKGDQPSRNRKIISEDDFYLKRKWKHAGSDTLILNGDIRLHLVRWMRWNIKLKGKQPQLSECKWVLEAIEQKLRDDGRIKIEENVQFERGRDPKEALGIGDTANFINSIKDLLRWDANEGHGIRSIQIGFPNNTITFGLNDWNWLAGDDPVPWIKKRMKEFDLSDYVDFSSKPIIINRGDGSQWPQFNLVRRLKNKFKDTKYFVRDGRNPNKVIEITER